MGDMAGEVRLLSQHYETLVGGATKEIEKLNREVRRGQRGQERLIKENIKLVMEVMEGQGTVKELEGNIMKEKEYTQKLRRIMEILEGEKLKWCVEKNKLLQSISNASGLLSKLTVENFSMAAHNEDLKVIMN